MNEYKEFESTNALSERNKKISLKPLKLYKTIDKFKFSCSTQSLFNKNFNILENNKLRKTINFNKIKSAHFNLNKENSLGSFTSRNQICNNPNFLFRPKSLRNITFGNPFIKEKRILYDSKKISALWSNDKIEKKLSEKKQSFTAAIKDMLKRKSSVFIAANFQPYMIKLEKLKHKNKKNKIFLYKGDNFNEDKSEEESDNKNEIIKTEKDYRNYINNFFGEYQEQIKLNNKINYGKKLRRNLNNKVFEGIINDCKELELKLDDNLNSLFEKEVKEYQLSHIFDLNEKIRNGENINAIKSLDNLNDLDKQAFKGTYFYVQSEQDEFIPFKDNQSVRLNSENKNNISTEQKVINNNENLQSKKKGKKDLFKKLKKNKKDKIKMYNVLGGEEFISQLNYSQGTNNPGLDGEGFEKLSKQSYIELYYIYNNENFHLFGIMDEHGKNCHLITPFISKYIKEYFLQKMKDIKPLFKEDMSIKEIYLKITKNKYEFIYILINKLQEALLKSSNINCSFTGSTCLLVFIIGNNVICSNIGDSRVILIEKKEIIQKIIVKLENLFCLEAKMI